MSAETQVLQAIAGRRSVRRFLDTPIPSARMEALITAACAAPSASNRQDWLFTLVTRAETRRALAAAVAACWERLVADCGSETIAEAVKGYATNLAWFDRAPVVVVLSCRRRLSLFRSQYGRRLAWCYHCDNNDTDGFDNRLQNIPAYSIRQGGTACSAGAGKRRRGAGYQAAQRVVG